MSLNYRVIKSFEKIYDRFGQEMNVHIREKDGQVQIIINRSCQECKKFGEIGDGTLICKKCHYQKDWLNRGMI